MVNVVVLCLVFVVHSYGSLTIANPEDVRGNYLAIGYSHLGISGNYSYNGDLVAFDPFNGCSEPSIPLDLEGKLVVVNEGNVCLAYAIRSNEYYMKFTSFVVVVDLTISCRYVCSL